MPRTKARRRHFSAIHWILLSFVCVLSACDEPSRVQGPRVVSATHSASLEPGSSFVVAYNTIAGGLIPLGMDYEAVVTSQPIETQQLFCTTNIGPGPHYRSSVNLVSSPPENGSRGEALTSAVPIPHGTRLALKSGSICGHLWIFVATVIRGDGS